MPYPTGTTYEFSTDALDDALDAFVALVDAGTGPGTLKVYDSGDTLLATFTFDDPCGAVTGGQLTLAFATGTVTAAASGTAYYAEIADCDANDHLDIRCASGGGAATGYLVLNTTSIIGSAPITIISATVG